MTTTPHLRRLRGYDNNDVQRGQLVSEAHDLIRNNGAIVVNDVIGDLLKSGAWRSYTYKDKSHHEWGDREFDYFISSLQLDWDVINGDIHEPDVRTLLSDHSTGPFDGVDRRRIKDLPEDFPDVIAIDLVSPAERAVANDPKRRRKYERGASLYAARTEGRRWRFSVDMNADLPVGDRADRIVAKLLQEPVLARKVKDKLLYELEIKSRRRRNGSRSGS